jgi:hypothetical protein
LSNAFMAPQPQLPQINTRASSSSTTAMANNNLFSSETEDNDDDTTTNDFAGFNPLQPGAKMPTKGGFGILSDNKPTPSSPGGLISPRQMRMKELTGDLLFSISDDDAVEKLLQSNEEFLLDQLNNLDAVLEVDSVYTPDMSRDERFGRYKEVMEERIKVARAPVAKKALGALMDFVLARE